MNIDSILKKKGITVIEQLSTLNINIIANNIATKLCQKFPEHDFNKSALFANLSRLNMYIADMPENLTMAKYFSENHSIYFNKNLNFNDIDTIILHECLHYLQENKSNFHKSYRLGLATFSRKPTGVSLNEAAVQLMASEANNVKEDLVTYYNISLPTSSPIYYTLECVLLKQISYFTGTYPLYHSTLYGNDIFKNTLIKKTSKTHFNIVQSNFDKLAEFEDNLNDLNIRLQNSNENLSTIKDINKQIEIKKREIFNLFLKTQNIIMTNGFNSEFKNIKTIADLKTFKSRLYNFQHLIGTSPKYTFYKDFFYYTMNKLEQKESIIQDSKEVVPTSQAMVLFDSSDGVFHFMKTFINKLRRLPLLRQQEQKNYN